MSLMVASTRRKDELSCSCSCDAPWLDWLYSWGAKLSVARESRVREMQSFIFLLQVIWFGTTFGEGAVKSREAQIIRPEVAPSQADAVKNPCYLVSIKGWKAHMCASEVSSGSPAQLMLMR